MATWRRATSGDHVAWRLVCRRSPLELRFIQESCQVCTVARVRHRRDSALAGEGGAVASEACDMWVKR